MRVKERSAFTAVAKAAGYEVSMNDKGELTITRYVGWDSDVVIPAQIGGKPVTVIGAASFKDCEITSVVIPDSVITIASGEKRQDYDSVEWETIGAFANNKLTRVVFGKGLTTIGDGAFLGNQLREVVLPASVKTIAPFAFADNRLTKVSIPDNAVVYTNAFASTGSYTEYITGLSVTVGNNVYIADGAFPQSQWGGNIYYYWSPEKVKEGLVTNITLGADCVFFPNTFAQETYFNYFCNDRKAGAYKAVRREIYHEDGRYTTYYSMERKKEGDFSYVATPYGAAITGYSGSAGNRLVIPDKLGGLAVKHIGEEAFAGEEISRFLIPSSVISIGAGAFSPDWWKKDGRESITIPDSVKFVGPRAFRSDVDLIDHPGSDDFGAYGIKTITIGANVKVCRSLPNPGERALDSFPDFFDKFYEENGRKAGTYTSPGEIVWTSGRATVKWTFTPR